MTTKNLKPGMNVKVYNMRTKRVRKVAITKILDDRCFEADDTRIYYTDDLAVEAMTAELEKMGMFINLSPVLTACYYAEATK